MTRSSANWATHPGGYDALHCERHIWPTDSPHGIPSLQPQRFDLPANPRLLPYRSRLDRLNPSRDLCHFYLDDYRFESTWTRLDIGARHVSGYFATLTPDFSLYPDWPIAAQLWNTYRSRWLGRYWQEGGLRVIPTVNWSDQRSFAFCFDGIPTGQLLSIGTADCRRAHVQRRFEAGLSAMLERLQPRALIVYGRLQPQQRHRIERTGCQLLEIAPPGSGYASSPSRPQGSLHEHPLRLPRVPGYLLIVQACALVRQQEDRVPTARPAHRRGDAARGLEQAPGRSQRPPAAE